MKKKTKRVSKKSKVIEKRIKSAPESLKKGRSKSSLKSDAGKQARKPGKRITEWESVYYEYRDNRSDKRKWL